MVRIEVDDPALPKGTKLSVYALGELENGKTVEFSKEEIEFFESEQGRSVEEAFVNNETVKVHTSKAKELEKEVT